MKPVIEFENVKVFHGSNLDVLPFMADNSVDSIVTDPPYELGFMGKKWDSTGIAYSVELWRECLRVLKPGGHLLAFGGSRTWHRLAVAIEDAGFEVRDSIAWLYGSGFPKSLDISKAIDKAAGVEREIVGTHNGSGLTRSNVEQGAQKRNVTEWAKYSDEPATPEAQKWQGWGTALKPAFEPVVVARKALIGTVAENVLEWGVGGLNIDASRIGTEQRTYFGGSKLMEVRPWNETQSDKPEYTVQGRWPANIILDEYTAGLLDEQSSITTGKVGMTGKTGATNSIYGDYAQNKVRTAGVTDKGGASRFFYVAKASKRDRNEGLDALPDYDWRGEGAAIPERENRPFIPSKNHHPTVKPTDLMRYLVKLVTPAGGTVLDPFTGSGSTGKAAILDGYKFIGIELTDDYLPIIEGRLQHATAMRAESLSAEGNKEKEMLF